MKKILILVLVSLFTMGCATLFKSKTVAINIDSDPQGAEIYINGNRVGKTPMPFNTSHKQPITLTFKKEGYSDKTYIINNSVGAGWVILDCVGGFIPVVIDAVTGNWYELDEKQVKVLMDAK